MLSWPIASGDFNLAPEDVHVWAFSLTATASELEEARAILSPDEKQRAQRFRFDIDRSRFTLGRARMRVILSRYSQSAPAELQFVYGSKGKPALAGGPERSEGLQFNLSHSEELGLLAVAWGRKVGVDVERVRQMDDAEELVARFFSVTELRKFSSLAAQERLPAFFNLWTRKEAWLKATGEGIGDTLNQVEVSFLPGEPPGLVRVGEETLRDNWVLVPLEPARGYVGAVVFTGTPVPVSCWRMN